MTVKNNLITADKGMVLTNGETFGKTVRLGKCGSVESWQEITEAEYEKIKEKEQKESL